MRAHDSSRQPGGKKAGFGRLLGPPKPGLQVGLNKHPLGARGFASCALGSKYGMPPAQRASEEFVKAMAHINRDLSVKFQTTRDGEVELTHFKAGDAITIVQTWERLVLIKDDEGHFYNVDKDAVSGA